MTSKFFYIALMVLVLTSCASTQVSNSDSEKETNNIVTLFPEQFKSPQGLPVIYGSIKKLNNRGVALAGAMFVSGNDSTLTQVLVSGINEISIFITNDYQFITAETEIFAVNGDEYFVNFEYRYPSAPLVVERIWITNSAGALIKEIDSWSQEHFLRELYRPNVS